MKAVKGNVQLTLSNDAEAKAYRGDGFDIYSDEGELLEHAAGKKISYEEHARLLEEAAAAAEAVVPDEKGLLAENKQLKKDLAEAQKQIDALSTELLVGAEA